MPLRLPVLLCLGALALAASTSELADLERDLQSILDERATVWNCTFSIAIKSNAKSALGGSVLAFSSGEATTKSKFAWGSITKMWTGASIMQLVARGDLKLEEPFAPYINKQFAAMAKIRFPGMHKFSQLSDLWGEGVNAVTVRDLLAMQSGIPDFDTANPNPYGKDLDPFRATVYSNPTHDFLEPALMSYPWVATHNLSSVPGTGFHYSSTNFGLLGLMLAQHAAVADYREFNQSEFIPESLAHIASEVAWAPVGSPRHHGVVAGFDRTDYNGQDPTKTGGVGVVDVNGVFAGYGAADFCGTPTAVAELGYALWGESSALVPRAYRDLMVPNLTTHDFRKAFYGLASQNVGLMGITGGEGMGDPYSVAYGHLGATYGYDSIFGYNPTLDVGISIGTNIETSSQTQPADAFCHIYNRVKNFLNKEPVVHCIYNTSGYYGGKCECK